MPRVRSTMTPRRVALAASRSQFGRARVRRWFAVLLACAFRAQPGAARLHNLECIGTVKDPLECAKMRGAGVHTESGAFPGTNTCGQPFAQFGTGRDHETAMLVLSGVQPTHKMRATTRCHSSAASRKRRRSDDDATPMSYGARGGWVTPPPPPQHTDTHKHKLKNPNTHTHTRAHTHNHTKTHTHTHTHTHTGTHTHTHTHTHTNTHTHTHTTKQTYTRIAAAHLQLRVRDLVQVAHLCHARDRCERRRERLGEAVVDEPLRDANCACGMPSHCGQPSAARAAHRGECLKHRPHAPAAWGAQAQWEPRTPSRRRHARCAQSHPNVIGTL